MFCCGYTGFFAELTEELVAHLNAFLESKVLSFASAHLRGPQEAMPEALHSHYVDGAADTLASMMRASTILASIPVQPAASNVTTLV